ncbi:MAG: hypothetical protein WC979_06520 [Candidatus Pacearchaeota archaeon]|jgi:hypothetical protein
MKREKEVITFGILFCLMIISLSSAATLEDSTSSNLNIKGGILCIDNGHNWSDSSDTTKEFAEIISTLNGSMGCYNENGRTEDGGQSMTSCCPSAYTCSQNPFGAYTCNILVTSKLFCADFDQSQDDCEGPLINGVRDGRFLIANYSVYTNNKHICGVDTNSYYDDGNTIYWNVTECYCRWNSTDSKCKAIENVTKKYKDNTSPTYVYGTCTWTLDDGYPVDECDASGYLRYSFTGKIDGDNYPGIEDCTKKEVQIPCESVTKLGFFNFINFIEAIFIIAFIYFVYINKNKYKK